VHARGAHIVGSRAAPRSRMHRSKGAPVLRRCLPLPLLLAACGGSGALGPAADPDPADPLAGFFGLETIHTVQIELDDAGFDSLLDDPYRYVEAAVTVDGIRYDPVGLRQKGHAGSFVPLDAGDGHDGRPPKPAFTVDLDRYVDGQRHLGLEKLVLNNLAQDPTGYHEFLGYSLFREGDVPACRTGWATLQFRGELKGLYVLVEATDDDVFLDRWYGTDRGNLYEGEYGVDLRGEMVDWFEQDHGDDESRDDLRELAEALDEIGDGDDGLAVLESYLDLERYLAFATTELVLGHWDGYAWSVNNYRVHHHPQTDDWTFLPWGLDQIFEAELWPHAGVIQSPGPAWKWGGRVHQVCIASPECRVELRHAFEATLERMEAMDLGDLAVQAREHVEDLVLEDADRWGDPDWARTSMDQVSWYIDERPAQVEQWLPCLDGEVVDLDGDGFDGCTEDCNDYEPWIHPGAEEECNFIDDDCNGVLDDPAECPRCRDEIVPGGQRFSLCLEWLGWNEARDYCVERGQDLASLHDGETFEQVGFGFLELAGVWESWIGLSDQGSEGDFYWSDGSDVDFAPWAEEEASEWGDCVVNSLWGWWAVDCDEALPFVCGGP